ncbi:MAG TPA: histidine phosphatase family protein [Solirubrobacteraceae bacterium]|nr:histidine phosphatase family protein [Solirubrobacteraceae bacterium]
MPSILLVRHAQASFGSEHYDVLSDHGAEQVRVLAADLERRGVRIDEVISGDLARQRDTAQPIAEAAGVELAIDARWNEYATADILAHHSDSDLREERQPRDATPPVSSRQPRDATPAGPSRQPRDATPPVSSREFQAVLERALHEWIGAGAGGPADEPWPAFARRVEAALRELADRLGSGRTALVSTSGGPLAAACVTLLDLDPHAFVAFNRVTVNTGITKVVSGRGGTTLVSFNEHAHLEQRPGRSLVTYR